MTTFNDLLAEKTQATWFTEARARLRSWGVPVDSWLSIVNTGLSTTQYLAEGLATVGAQVRGILRALFLDTSSGDGLTLYARSQFGLERLDRRSTIGNLVFTAAVGAGPYAKNAGEITVGTPGSKGQLYTNLDALTLPAGASRTVRIAALTPGAAGNVPAGSITELKSPAMGGVSVMNYAGWITSAGSDGEYGPDGGYSEQGDALLKRRCSLRNAVVGELVENPATGDTTVVVSSCTADAYEFWARYPVSGGTTSPVSKVAVLSNWRAGVREPQAVTVVVAGPAGVVTAPDRALVRANFETPRRYPLGVKLYVDTVSAVSVTVSGTVYVRAPYSVADIQTAVAAALARYQAELGIGETLYRSRLIEVVIAANDRAIRNLDLVTPAADVTAMGPTDLIALVNSLSYVQV